MSINESLQQLNEQSDKFRSQKIAFIRRILAMASILLGVLIALHPAASKPHPGFVLFALGLNMLVSGILGLALGLYGEVNLQKTLFLNWKEQVKSQLDGNKPEIVFAKGKRIYAISETIGYVCCLLALILLSVSVWIS